jgi:regulator of protease activity HflC (stomatin/prohibitin superfamily)
MEAERRRRQQELDTMAKINVSEGEKKSAVLKSLGELETVKNQTEGLVDQLKRVSKEIGSIDEGMKFLLEIRKYDAMKELANGPNNTFFLPDSKSLLALAPQQFNKSSNDDGNNGAISLSHDIMGKGLDRVEKELDRIEKELRKNKI